MDKVTVAFTDDVAIIRLNDPATLNAIDVPMLEALSTALETAWARARAIILTGEGRAFSSGGKLDASLLAAPAPDLPDAGALLESHVNPLMRSLADSPIPWISAVRGATAGVGCSIALAADLVVAAEDAYFLQAFAKIGLVPDGGAAWLLTRTVGRARAMEMMLLAERIPASRALDWGLISRVVPGDQLEAEALALARGLAQGPTAGLGLIRKLAWAAADAPWAQSLRAESEAQSQAGRSLDFREGVEAFLARRPANFAGR